MWRQQFGHSRLYQASGFDELTSMQYYAATGNYRLTGDVGSFVIQATDEVATLERAHREGLEDVALLHIDDLTLRTEFSKAMSTAFLVYVLLIALLAIGAAALRYLTFEPRQNLSLMGTHTPLLAEAEDPAL